MSKMVRWSFLKAVSVLLFCMFVRPMPLMSQKTQGLYPMPDGIMNNSRPVLWSGNGKLYAANAARNFINQMEIYASDGISHTRYKGIPFSDTGVINDVFEYHGDLYLAGTFHFSETRNYGMLRFDGSQWDTVAETRQLVVQRAAQVWDRLFFTASASVGFPVSLYEMAGGKLQHLRNTTGSNSRLIATTQTLFFAADFLYAWNGSNWDSTSNNWSGAKLAVLHDTLICASVGDTVFVAERNASVKKLFALSSLALNTIAVQGDFIYGISNLGADFHSRYSTKTSVLDTFAINFTNGVSSNNAVYGYRFDGSGTATLNRMHSSTQVVVYAKLYEDVNLNCQYESGDKSGPGLNGYFANGNDTLPFYSNDSSEFRMVLPVKSGNWSMVLTDKYHQSSTQVCLSNLAFPNPGNYGKLYLPFSVSKPDYDVRVKLGAVHGPQALKGGVESVYIMVDDLGKKASALTLELFYTDSSEYVSSTVSPVISNQGYLKFNLINPQVLPNGKLVVALKVVSLYNLGSGLRYKVSAKLANGDSDNTDNTDSIKQTVVAVLDPNAKHSTPEGKVNDPVSKISYNIHFQNTGADTAFRVIVVDTLDIAFSLIKLQMTGYSHPCNFRFEQPNILIWEFENIRLPSGLPEATNNAGYINFEAPLRVPTKKGQVVQNRAHIYFDYQKPVSTNWDNVEHQGWGVSVSAVGSISGIRAYPNPVAQWLTLESKSANCRYELYDLHGHLLVQGRTESGKAAICMQYFASGIYLLHSSEGSIKIIKQ